MPKATRGYRSPSQSPSSERSESKRKRRRSGSIKAEEETSTEAAGTRIREDGEKETKKREDEDEDEEVVSSAPSSPLYELPDDDPDTSPELIEAWNRAERDYQTKMERYGELVTIEYARPSHMFFDPELLPVAEPATNAVLLAARFVIGLSSSSFEGQRARKRCSGFWVDWNEENKTGIVLTTAHLFSSKACSVEQAWEGFEGEYASYGVVKYYPNAKYDNGGPIIDLDAKIVGMINCHRTGAFIPSSVLLKCMDLWKEFGCIPRPQLGLTFSGIKLLDIARVEKIWRKYKIDDGLIVNEVLKGSLAEEIGIRTGDIIESFNGECISNTVQLENLLLSLCKSAGNGCDSKIHVSVAVFHVRKLRRKIREFTAGVSEHLEFIDRGTHLHPQHYRRALHCVGVRLKHACMCT